MEPSSILQEISDSVHCPVCLELYVDPRTLPCLHTFCHACVVQIVKNNTIECPSCRKVTARQNITSDFKTKQLVEIYQKESASCASTSSHGTTKHPCDLCEDRNAKLFCKNCQRRVCEICCKSHIKLSECELSQTEEIIEERSEVLKSLDSASEELQRDIQKFNQSAQEAREAADQLVAAQMQEISSAEEETLKKVHQWYNTQRNTLVEKKENHHQKISKESQQLLSTAQKFAEDLVETLQQPSQEVESSCDMIKQQIKMERLKLRQHNFSPLKISIKNKTSCSAAFDENKALKIEDGTKEAAAGVAKSGPENIEAATREIYDIALRGSPPVQRAGVRVPQRSNNQRKTLHNSVLAVERKAPLCEAVVQLRLVSGQMWALMADHIRILRADGTPGIRLKAKFSAAHDMCVLTTIPNMIVATGDSGLLQVSFDGQILKQIDKGKFWCVTCSNNLNFPSVWALKERQEGEEICVIEYKLVQASTNKWEAGLRVQTSIHSNSCTLYGTIFNGYLYICSQFYSCIFKTEISYYVRAMEEHGGQGDQLPGEMDGPLTMYHDELTNSLLVVDSVNHRLQLFDPNLDDWTLVKTIGEKLLYPTAVATDARGRYWVTGGDPPYYLYVCTMA